MDVAVLLEKLVSTYQFTLYTVENGTTIILNDLFYQAGNIFVLNGYIYGKILKTLVFNYKIFDCLKI
jgi:hypothetical protein